MVEDNRSPIDHRATTVSRRQVLAATSGLVTISLSGCLGDDGGDGDDGSSGDDSGGGDGGGGGDDGGDSSSGDGGDGGTGATSTFDSQVDGLEVVEHSSEIEDDGDYLISATVENVGEARTPTEFDVDIDVYDGDEEVSEARLNAWDWDVDEFDPGESTLLRVAPALSVDAGDIDRYEVTIECETLSDSFYCG